MLNITFNSLIIPLFVHAIAPSFDLNVYLLYDTNDSKNYDL